MQTAHEFLLSAKKLGDNGQWAEAFRTCIRGMQEYPREAILAQHAGLSAIFLGKYRDAVQCYERSISIDPTKPLVWTGLGNALLALEDFQGCVKAYRRALEIDPNEIGAHFGLSAVLEQCDELGVAIEHAQRSIELAPLKPEGYANMSFRLRDSGDIDGAIEILDLANKRIPEDFENQHSRVSYLNYSARYTPQEVFEGHRWLGQLIAPPVVNEFKDRDFDPDRKLQVGIISADLRIHSVAFFIEPLLQNYNNSDWHLICYPNHTNSDDFTKRASKLVESWKPIAGKSESDLAKVLQADKLDVIIELNGWTIGHKLHLLATRMAPIQITYLGYPNTTGVPAMDYRIVDEGTDPPGAESLSTEKLMRLPGGMHAYAAPPDAPNISELPALKSGAITFGSFNSLMKVNPEVIETWSEILKAVPNSRLLIKTHMLKHPVARERIERLFRENGIALSRIEILEKIEDMKGHLGVYERIDLALDTFPYNGTTTTCDALWMGVPVIGFAGGTHAGRVTASLMHRVGLGDFIGQSREEMVQKAVEWSKRIPELSEIRMNLRERMLASPLLDGARLAREIQAQVREAWHSVCRSYLDL